jgi:hypothetical protein
MEILVVFITELVVHDALSNSIDFLAFVGKRERDKKKPFPFYLSPLPTLAKRVLQ